MEVGRVYETLEFSVPAQAASLVQVRRRLRGFLAEHKVREDQRDDVVLVAHELAANAIVHGSSDQDEEVAITIRLEPRSVVIRVSDSARTDAMPAPLEPTDWRESGRGMLIVDELATWRQELRDGHREVTAKLSLRPACEEEALSGS
jgi:anti-sigma regulatory factor (Ser/Thr protein kinase)